MSKFTSPAFQFYPKDWLSDPDVICMKLAERGAYITLLCFCWIKKTIPDDIPSLASLCGITTAEMEGIWPALKPCFKKSNPTGRLYNKRLAQERKAQKTRAATRTASGEKGAKKRWNKSRDIKEVDSAAIVLPMANNSSSSSSSTSSTSVSTPPTPSRGWRVEKFDELWKIIWAKIGKGSAEKAFKRMAKTPEEADRIIAAARAQGPRLVKEAQQQGRSVLHPTSWINAKRFTDEVADVVNFTPQHESRADANLRLLREKT